MPKYKVTLDREGCIGATACAAVGPDFWKMAADGKVDLIGAKFNEETKKWELIIEDKDYAINDEAVKVCPVNAIKIEKIEG